MTQQKPHEEPISPELAMIDPELARRHALTPGAWETARVAQEVPRQAREHDEGAVESSRSLRRGALLLAMAAAIAAAGALVLDFVGVFRGDSRTAVRTPSTTPHTAHASAKRARPRPQLTPSRPARSGPAKRPVAPAAVLPSTAPARTVAPTATTTTAQAPAKPHARPHRSAGSGPFAPPTAPATATAGARVVPTPRQRAPQPQPQPRPGGSRSVHPVPPRPETFVWTSVPGATEYHVAFFKSGRAILVRRTRTARLTVPGTWHYAGKVQTFAPGRYEWYVWFARGSQSSGLVVSSTIVITGRGPSSHRARH